MRYVLVLFVICTACAVPTELPQSSCTQEFHAHLNQQPVAPIEVRVNQTMPEAHQVAFAEAVEWWNQRLGTTMFTITATDQPFSRQCGVAWVEMGTTPESKDGWTLNTDCWAHVTISDTASFQRVGYLPWLARHELGHVLNLQHDESDISNLMQPLYHAEQDLHLNDGNECFLAMMLTLQDGDETRLSDFR